MSYQPPPQGYPPYGAPQGHSPQPGYNQYPPPQGQYPPQQYGASSSGQYQQPPYGAPPPQQYPPQGYGAPPPQQQYGGPPPQQPYGQPSYGAPPPQQYGVPPPQPYGVPPPQQYGAPPPQQYAQPTPPSLGYGPAQQIGWDGVADAEGLKKAMKGFGTDEKALIRILAPKDPLQINVLRQTYNHRFGKILEKEVAGETSGWFEQGLRAIIRGPLNQDVHLLHEALSGPGTKEIVLNDVLLARSNADMRAIKEAYHATHRRSLENDVKADLSMKTERHFMMVLAANRTEETAPVIPQQIDQDVMELYKATEGKVGTDELLVCSILTQRSDAQIRAIAQTYEAKFRRSLDHVIIKEFSGHMEKALLSQLRAGTDRAMRDAMLLEDAMSGAGTKDHFLIERVVRCHWDRNHMMQVRGAYKHKFRQELSHRIKGETSGDYERLMLACIGDQV